MTYLVLVSDVCDMWLEQSIARKVAKELLAGTLTISVNGCLLATHSIKGIIEPSVYKTQRINQRRNWTCQKGAGHTFDQRCDCKDAQAPTDLSQPVLNAKNELSPEQQAFANLKAAANREWIMKCKPDWKAAADSEARKVFVDNYVKNNGKSIDRQ